MVYAVINRLKDNDHKQSLGHFILYEDLKVLFECKTLELPDLGNKRNVSRIPAGIYICKERYSQKHLYHYHLQDVPNRSLILIHSGNYKSQIEGCILVGKNFLDINKDGHLDVTESRKTLSKLISELLGKGKEFKLIINDIDNLLESI